MALERDGQNPSGYLGINPVKTPETIRALRVPTTTDRRFKIGTVWINTASNQAYFLTSVVAGSATWALASPGASDVDTINSLSPAAGNIIIAGGTNLTDVNAGSTVTLNMDAAITLATSVTSALYTTPAEETKTFTVCAEPSPPHASVVSVRVCPPEFNLSMIVAFVADVAAFIPIAT